ncbi:MAG TPA: cell division protein FtsZ, partial [Xanthobacteraceae bacterium]
GVVTKPFHFEGQRRMRCAEAGIVELQKFVDTLIIIPNQNLFRVANEKTTFADAFAMADQVLYSGVACITDLMVKEGLINLDFADVRAVMREMGKAMMGTGEASGEKRALRSAEAAIANPLIDDVSMKGARGLLISITGGKDLTLYEVDEAATRIREEVDQDANIIVGATFDESLEGVIRVSVVATGVDDVVATAARPTTTVAHPAAVANHESRIAELTQRLRADTQRMQERIERTEARPQPAAHAPTPVETAATAAVAAALEDVTIRPIAPKPTLFDQVTSKPAAPAPEPAMPKVFIPPQAERPATRAPRMPRIDEFPMPAQNEIRAKQAEAVDPADKPRMSLLARLASVGLGRREEEHEPAAAERAAARPQLPPLPERAPVRPQMPRGAESRAPDARSPDGVSEYAKRAVPQGLDQHGRAAPVHNPVDDDQLEIPAFLRRQAN